jgi:hypothetical protein
VGIGGVAGVAGETELVARLDDGAGMGESRIEAAGLHVGIEDDDITMLDEVVVAGAIGNGRGNWPRTVLEGTPSTTTTTVPSATARTGLPQMRQCSFFEPSVPGRIWLHWWELGSRAWTPMS